jgi:hypothetical protein
MKKYAILVMVMFLCLFVSSCSFKNYETGTGTSPVYVGADDSEVL